jgi:type II secretory pathway component PulF
MGPAVLLGFPLLAVVTTFTLGFRRRRQVERRAAIADALALSARREVPLHVPLARAADVARGRHAIALRAVATDLPSGRALAETLRARLRREFPAAVAAAIDAGEKASRLPEALEAVAAEASRDLASGHKMALAALYPAILFVGVAALNLLVLEGQLRWLNIEHLDQFTIGPALAVRWALYAVAGLVLGSVAWRRLRRPVTGVAAARFLRTTSLLLASGRSVHAALSTASSSAGAPRLARAAAAAARRVEGGELLSDTWRSLPIPRAARERLASSAAPGLASLLEDIAADCEARDARRADRFIRWSVPVATAAAGLLVALDYATLMSVWAHAQELARPW